MNLADLFSLDAAPAYAAIATTVGVAWTIFTGIERNVPFYAEYRGDPAKGFYLLGHDGTEAQIDDRGKGSMPGGWRGKLVIVRSCEDHRQVHSFYLRPVRGQLLRIVLPPPV